MPLSNTAGMTENSMRLIVKDGLVSNQMSLNYFG